MTPRWIKIALAGSVALNLFAAGALAAGLVNGVFFAPPPPPETRGAHRRPPVMAMVEQLPEARRHAVRETLRTSALAARPDFEAARTARREAVDLARAEPFDRDAVKARLDASREAERRGQARLETDTLDLLGDLPQAERAVLAPMLARNGGRGGRRGGPGGPAGEGPPPPPPHGQAPHVAPPPAPPVDQAA